MSDPKDLSYILIPGAGGMAWYWHRVVALLEQAQREAIAVDLPGDDESAGLDDYAEIVVREIGQRTNVTLVAQSLGAFTAAVACERISVFRQCNGSRPRRDGWGLVGQHGRHKGTDSGR
jgi:pimeloyl-ACP methyl ester carboxylesterase